MHGPCTICTFFWSNLLITRHPMRKKGKIIALYQKKLKFKKIVAAGWQRWRSTIGVVHALWKSKTYFFYEVAWHGLGWIGLAPNNCKCDLDWSIFIQLLVAGLSHGHNSVFGRTSVPCSALFTLSNFKETCINIMS